MKKLLTIAATVLGGYSILAADLRISDLPEATSVVGSNTLPVVITPRAVGGLSQITASNLLRSLITFPGFPGSSATNAVADINGNPSNHQFIVVTTNGFVPGSSSASGLNGNTNYINIPQASNYISGFLLSNDWAQFKASQSGSFVLTNFLFLGMSNVDLTQFIVSQGKLIFRDGGRDTNHILYGGINGSAGYVTWTNAATDGRFALVDSNRTPILRLRYTNDPASPTILHSKIYYGGGSDAGGPFVIPGHYWEDHQFLLPDFVNDPGIDTTYVQLSINYDDFFAWLFKQNRFLIQDTGGGGALYNIFSNSLSLANFSYGDTNANHIIYGRGMTIRAQNIAPPYIPYINSSYNLSNLVIGSGLLLSGNTLSATASGGSPGGLDMAVQFNQGGSTLAGTNTFKLDRTNVMLTIGRDDISTASILIQPNLWFQSAALGSSITTTNGAPLAINVSNATHWTFQNNAFNFAFIPQTDNSYDIGTPSFRVRTNYANWIDTSNFLSKGSIILTNHAPAVVGTNLQLNGTLGDYYEVFLNGITGGNGVTNIIFTNIQQTIVAEIWATNGSSVNLMFDAGNSFPAGWYYDQAIIPVDTNGPTRVTVWRSSRGTNVLVKTKSFSLQAAGSNVLLTNWAQATITVSNNASGSGGSTNLDSIFVTNQVVYIPLELNGSNTVNTSGTTNNWDMRLATFRPYTNFIIGATNGITLSNVIRGASGIATFIGANGWSNYFAIKATAGINIKWMNWITNGFFDFIVRPNNSYTLQFFADRDTNVNAWVSTDDTFIPGFTYQVGLGSSNITVPGKMFFSTAVTTNNNLVTVFTNLASYTVPGNTLTNNGDQVIADWGGRILSGTNTLNFGYTGVNTNVLSTGSFTNLGPINYNATLIITRTSANAAHVEGYFAVPNGNGVFFNYTNVNAEIATDTGTNATFKFDTFKTASSGVVSITNNYFKVRYEPASR